MIEIICLLVFLGFVVVGCTWCMDKEMEKQRNKYGKK
jgi:hypothetical protein